MTQTDPNAVVGDYLFIQGVDGLELECKRARVQVGAFTFVPRSLLLRLLRSRDRGVKKLAKHLRDPLAKPRLFCIVEKGGRPRDLSRDTLSQAREALDLLATQVCFWTTREFGDNGFAMSGDAQRGVSQHVILGLSNRVATSSSSIQGSVVPLTLRDDWQTHREHHQLAVIVEASYDTTLDDGWRRQVRRSAVCVGRSIRTRSMSDAFLQNVFALETLLTRRGERNARALWRRVGGLAGWFFAHSRRSGQTELTQLYNVRCEMVHDADFSNLGPEVLLHADEYARNILVNVCRARHRWRSKADLIAFADQISSGGQYPQDYEGRWRAWDNWHSPDRYDRVVKAMMD